MTYARETYGIGIILWNGKLVVSRQLQRTARMRGSRLSSKLSKRGALFGLFEGLINALDSTDINKVGNVRTYQKA